MALVFGLTEEILHNKLKSLLCEKVANAKNFYGWNDRTFVTHLQGRNTKLRTMLANRSSSGLLYNCVCQEVCTTFSPGFVRKR